MGSRGLAETGPCPHSKEVLLPDSPLLLQCPFFPGCLVTATASFSNYRGSRPGLCLFHVSGNMYVIVDPTELPPAPCPLFSSCSVASGSWLTAGQLWMLALHKGCPYPSLGFMELEQLSAAGEALVGRPSPIRSQSSTTGFLAISEGSFPFVPSLVGLAEYPFPGSLMPQPTGTSPLSPPAAQSHSLGAVTWLPPSTFWWYQDCIQWSHRHACPHPTCPCQISE